MYPILTRERDYLYRQIKREALWRVFSDYNSPTFNPINAVAAYYRIDMTEIHRVLYSLEGCGLNIPTHIINKLWDVFVTSLIDAGCCNESDRRLVKTRLHVSAAAQYGDPKWWSFRIIKNLLQISKYE
jgi:hypothetical protein